MTDQQDQALAGPHPTAARESMVAEPGHAKICSVNRGAGCDCGAPKGSPIFRPATAARRCPKCSAALSGAPKPRHLVACGDSRDLAVWALLFADGQLARMVWTDPPYGVQYVGVDGSREMIQGDDLDEAGLSDMLRRAFGAAVVRCQPGAAWYVAAPPGPLFWVFGGVLREFGTWRHTIAWVKDALVLGRCDFHYRHEAVFYGWVPGGPHHWCGRRDLDTVHQFDRPRKSGDHPTMKPVALVAHHVTCSSEPGWVVADPFAGSGTTLAACVQTGRVFRGIEIDPKYVDVIRRRFAAMAAERGIAAGPGALVAAAAEHGRS